MRVRADLVAWQNGISEENGFGGRSLPRNESAIETP